MSGPQSMLKDESLILVRDEVGSLTIESIIASICYLINSCPLFFFISTKIAVMIAAGITTLTMILLARMSGGGNGADTETLNDANTRPNESFFILTRICLCPLSGKEYFNEKSPFTTGIFRNLNDL